MGTGGYSAAAGGDRLAVDAEDTNVDRRGFEVVVRSNPVSKVLDCRQPGSWAGDELCPSIEFCNSFVPFRTRFVGEIDVLL